MQSCVVLLNKPTGMSSNTAVNKVKQIFNAKKSGHFGTLDPMGSGLLPIAINKATKIIGCNIDKTKTYRAVFKFGIKTNTLDSEGEVVCVDDKVVTFDELSKVVKEFIGKHNQMPPQYSAKKINGQKACDIARAGGVACLTPKQIEIYSFDVVKELEKNTFIVEVRCSEGTYIRSLCRDVAEQLSTYGIMSAICRTTYGDLILSDSFVLSDAQMVKKINFDEFLQLEHIFVGLDYVTALYQGKHIAPTDNMPIDRQFLLYFNDSLFAVCSVKNDCCHVDTYFYEEKL